ncbi:MAG: SAM-dependent methyltransferase [Acidobacteriota bacterium]
MRKDYSRTAEAVALARAIQQNLPPSQRILDDPYASAFIQHPYLRLVARSPMRSRLLSRFLDFWATGGQEFVAIRARFADELASEMVGQGLQQLVLLGAGFDSMALRIQQTLRGVTVFEVDHPATQKVKRRVLERLGIPDNLRFVAVDFEKDNFVEKLQEAGCASHQLSLIIWMGVSYYLTEQAMARALTQIRLLGSQGSKLTFDYFLQEVIDQTTPNAEARFAARRVAQLGEPWLFGLQPEAVADYLKNFGFRLIHDYDAEGLRHKFHLRRFKPIDYAHIVVCEHAGKA